MQILVSACIVALDFYGQYFNYTVHTIMCI
eukprot:COSAG03_NODE_17002_length_386_cov_1.188153_1_plen_29_part_10